MRIDRRFGTAPGELRGWRLQAVGNEFQHCHDLFARHVEPLHNLVDGSAGFEVLENCRHRHAGVLKHPSAAPSAGDTLDRGALRPIECCHFPPVPSSPFYHTWGARSRREADFDQVRRSARPASARLFSRWFDDMTGGRHAVVVVVGEARPRRKGVVTAYAVGKLGLGDVEWSQS